MALLGGAALAMWWDMAPTQREDFEHWHTHEHFPERLGIPGFLRASRFASADGGEGFFVLYELAAHETLSSPPYLARLNAPTPWSQRLMPHHRNMVRSQTRVVASHGGVTGGCVLALRFSPATERGPLEAHLRALVDDLPRRPGLAGAHLLQTETPAIAATEEQRIRGGRDQAADGILLVAAYEPHALEALRASELSEQALKSAGAREGAAAGLYQLRLSMTPNDVP